MNWLPIKKKKNKNLHCSRSHLHGVRRRDECEGGGDIQSGKVSGFKESITQRWQASDDYVYIEVSRKKKKKTRRFCLRRMFGPGYNIKIDLPEALNCQDHVSRLNLHYHSNKSTMKLPSPCHILHRMCKTVNMKISF